MHHKIYNKYWKRQTIQKVNNHSVNVDIVHNNVSNLECLTAQ